MARIAHLLADATSQLRAAGVETPVQDARLLLGHVLGRSHAYLHAHGEEPVVPEAAAALAALLRRRAAREPLPYLLGRWEFLGLPFLVTPAVLIPRPETETLVEAAAARLPASARVMDVGAGSGCVAAGLARLLPRATVLALEPSAPAAAVARRNLELLGYAGRVRVVETEFPPPPEAGGADLDGVVSNPPYIASAEVEALQPEVRDHEPREALDGGPDGLRLLRLLAADAPALLRPGGLLALEVAAGQAESVAALLGAAGAWSEPELVPDLAGIPRVVLARRSDGLADRGARHG